MLFATLMAAPKHWPRRVDDAGDEAAIGVRMAVGAAPGEILRLVVGHGLWLSGAGVLLGLFAAVALTRAKTTMLVGVRPMDPLTFAAAVVLFFVIAVVSSWLQPAARGRTGSHDGPEGRVTHLRQHLSDRRAGGRSPPI